MKILSRGNLTLCFRTNGQPPYRRRLPRTQKDYREPISVVFIFIFPQILLSILTEITPFSS